MGDTAPQAGTVTGTYGANNLDEYTQAGNLQLGYDPDGDLTSRTISIFQVQHNPNFPSDDIAHQYKYIGAAPQDSA